MKKLSSLPPRPIDGHKGTFGRVLIVGGSEGMLGAPVLAGTAALRMGAGLVQIAVQDALLLPALSITPELIGLGLGERFAEKKLLEAAERADAIVIGPGIGQSTVARQRVLKLIQLAKPCVIDADALNSLAAEKTWPKKFAAQAVLTPHPGEMGRLSRHFGETKVPGDEKGRIAIAAKAAETFKQCIVLKGSRTVITDGERLYINTTGNSSLSKAGTGDVLSGMIGTLLAQKLDLFDAACLGCHLHGRAGEIAGEHFGLRSVLARDVINSIAEALLELEAIAGKEKGAMRRSH